MDTIKLLVSNFGVIITVITSVITIASLITVGTKTPKAGTWLAKVYKIVEYFALVVGKAKDK